MELPYIKSNVWLYIRASSDCSISTVNHVYLLIEDCEAKRIRKTRQDPGRVMISGLGIKSVHQSLSDDLPGSYISYSFTY